MHASLSDFLLDPYRSGDYFIDMEAGFDTITRYILNSVLKQGTRPELGHWRAYTRVYYFR